MNLGEREINAAVRARVKEQREIRRKLRRGRRITTPASDVEGQVLFDLVLESVVIRVFGFEQELLGKFDFEVPGSLFTRGGRFFREAGRRRASATAEGYADFTRLRVEREFWHRLAMKIEALRGDGSLSPRDLAIRAQEVRETHFRDGLQWKRHQAEADVNGELAALADDTAWLEANMSQHDGRGGNPSFRAQAGIRDVYGSDGEAATHLGHFSAVAAEVPGGFDGLLARVTKALGRERPRGRTENGSPPALGSDLAEGWEGAAPDPGYDGVDGADHFRAMLEALSRLDP